MTRREPEAGGDYIVIVCSVCRTASCWHGEFMCEASRSAGIVKVPASKLRVEDREHPCNYSVAKILEVYGAPPEAHDEA